MKKLRGNSLNLIACLALMLSLMPNAFAACDYTINALPGQVINLTATPTNVSNYYYLWTQTPANGITLPAVVDTPILTFSAPAYVPGGDNHYDVTVKVINRHPVTGTCTDSKTVCINVGQPLCPMCDNDVCLSSLPGAPECPPYFNYIGLEGDEYIYKYETLSHAGYTGVTLYSGPLADYSLDPDGWDALDQPTVNRPHVCTDLKFSITKNGVLLGEPCTRTVCLNYNPSAAIIVVS